MKHREEREREREKYDMTDPDLLPSHPLYFDRKDVGSYKEENDITFLVHDTLESGSKKTRILPHNDILINKLNYKDTPTPIPPVNKFPR